MPTWPLPDCVASLSITTSPPPPPPLPRAARKPLPLQPTRSISTPHPCHRCRARFHHRRRPTLNPKTSSQAHHHPPAPPLPDYVRTHLSPSPDLGYLNRSVPILFAHLPIAYLASTRLCSIALYHHQSTATAAAAARSPKATPTTTDPVHQHPPPLSPLPGPFPSPTPPNLEP